MPTLNKEPSKVALQIRRRPYPYNSPLYTLVQMTSALLSLNIIFPAVLPLSWSGSLFEQALFLLVFGIAYILASFLLLAVSGYIAVFIEVARNLKRLKMEDVNDPEVARGLAVRVLMSNQPRWLISITPCAVPAAAMAAACMIFQEKLSSGGAVLLSNGALILIKACLLHGLSSFIICLPFIIKTQRIFNADIIIDKEQPSK